MANNLQFKRGTTARRLTYTPVDGELVYDKTLNRLFMGNGSTAGGVDLEAIDNSKVAKQTAITGGVRYFDLASFYNATPALTGAIVIHLPVAKASASTMLFVNIRGYNYQNNVGAFDLICGFYQYGAGGSILSSSAAANGTFPSDRIRYGKAADHSVIILGDVNTVWSYPNLRVAEVATAYGSQTGWDQGWSISLETDLTGITGLVEPNAYGPARTKNAEKLLTTRNIAMTGDVAWSVNFDGSANTTAAATLSSTGVSAGTYQSVTVDTKGRVSAGAPVVSGLVTAATATGTANVVTANTTTYLNLVETIGATPTTAGASTQITGAGSVTVASDAAGKLTITGAQDVTGNAGTATTSNALSGIDNRTIKPSGAVKKATTSYFTSVDGLNGATSGGGYLDLLVLNNYADGSGGKTNALAFSKASMSIIHYQAAQADTLWGVGKTLAYVTDNVASATKLQTARNINGIAFDGTADITITDNTKAALDSPAFIGIPTAPTAVTATNDTQLATTAFVQAVNLADTGASATALALKTARTFTYTGDVTGNLSFNGSANVSAGMTLTNSGAVAGTYKAVTVDVKGRVTEGVALTTGLVTSTTSAGTTNLATTNTNTYLNVVETVGTTPTTAGTSTQVTGAGTVTVASDTAGKLVITGAQAITGNAGSATKLATPRAINGTNFDGTAAITVPVNVTTLATNGVDLNTFQIPGFYSCPANATAATLLNCPTTMAFSLLVEKSAGTKQTLTEYVIGSPKTYSRNFYTTWGQWYRVYTTIDAPPTSDFLGSVQWYSGKRASVPDGYVTLDGQLVNRTAFPDLWAAVNSGAYPLVTDSVWLAGTANRASYSSGNASSTFRLPDLNGAQTNSMEGVFLRGDGNGSIAGVAATIGSVQGDAIRNIKGTGGWAEAGGVFEVDRWDNSPFYLDVSKGWAGQAGNRDFDNGNMGFDASRVVPVANENRPVSAVGVWIVLATGATSPLPASGSPATLLANTFNGSQKIVGNLEVTGNLVISGTLAFAKGFENSLNETGWQKLPGGLILQWGYIPRAGSGTMTATFPIVFPQVCLGVYSQMRSTSQNYQSTTVNLLSPSGFTLYWDNGPTGFYFFAIGK